MSGRQRLGGRAGEPVGPRVERPWGSWCGRWGWGSGRAGGQGGTRAMAGLPRPFCIVHSRVCFLVEAAGPEKRLFMTEDPGQPREHGMEALRGAVGAPRQLSRRGEEGSIRGIAMAMEW